MHMIFRVLLAIAVIIVDLLVFFMPLTGFFMAYVLIFNPPWFREFLNRLADAPGRQFSMAEIFNQSTFVGADRPVTPTGAAWATFELTRDFRRAEPGDCPKTSDSPVLLKDGRG